MHAGNLVHRRSCDEVKSRAQPYNCAVTYIQYTSQPYSNVFHGTHTPILQTHLFSASSHRRKCFVKCSLLVGCAHSRGERELNSEVSGVCLDDAHGLLELAELAIRLVELCVDILHRLSRLLKPNPDREEPRCGGRGFALRTRAVMLGRIKTHGRSTNIWQYIYIYGNSQSFIRGRRRCRRVVGRLQFEL